MSALSFTFRVDSVMRSQQAPELALASVSFEPEFYERLSRASEQVRALSRGGLLVPYIPLLPIGTGPSAGFEVAFLDNHGEESEDIDFAEVRVRANGAVEFHGLGHGLESQWCRADTTLDEMALAMNACRRRQRRGTERNRMAA